MTGPLVLFFIYGDDGDTRDVIIDKKKSLTLTWTKKFDERCLILDCFMKKYIIEKIP